MGYKLSTKAEEDIIEIYQHGFQSFGEEQADHYHNSLAALFDLIVQNPKMARLRTEFEPAVRIHPFGAHIVIYQMDGEDVLIIRVRHSYEDWASETVSEILDKNISK